MAFLGFLFSLLWTTVVGICVSILLLAVIMVVILKTNKRIDLSLRSCANGYWICLAINVFVFIAKNFMPLLFYVLPLLFLFLHIIIFLPFMFFSFMLSKKMIKETKLRNLIINFIYKLTAVFLIWLVAFFPFSLFGIIELINMPTKNAQEQEILQQQEEILNSQTFTDLTPFGLGIYKLQNEGDEYLWDITKPENYVVNYDDIYWVYETYRNRKGYNIAGAYDQQGMDEKYDVFFYEGTYIIVSPLWDEPGIFYYWGYIYLCKDIDKDADLFQIGILDPEVVEKLQELPGEKFSKKEITEKLGKAF